MSKVLSIWCTCLARETRRGVRSFPGRCKPSRKIVGGNEQLPLALARSLPQGCIHLSHQLVALERTSDASLTLTFAAAGGTFEVHCDCAILALSRSAPYVTSIIGGPDLIRSSRWPLKSWATARSPSSSYSLIGLTGTKMAPGLALTMALSSPTWIFRRSGTRPLVKPAQRGCLSIIRADREEPLMRHRWPIARQMTPQTLSSMPRTASSNWSLSCLASAPTISERQR